MNDKRKVLRHFLATLAYRTQHALNNAPESFSAFEGGNDVRTPHQILRHMTGCIHWAMTAFEGGTVDLPELATFSDELSRFHESLEKLGYHLDHSELRESSLERLLHGPMSDALTHAGQLAMLRRLHGSPVKGQNFREAKIDADHLGEDQG